MSERTMRRSKGMLKIFGLTLARTSTVNRMAELSYYKGVTEGRQQIQFESGRAMHSIRDMVHNLPLHLNFEHEEDAGFCHQVLSMSFYLTMGRQRKPTRYHSSLEMRERLIGKGPLLSGAPLMPDDFEKAEQGDYERAAYIAKVIFGVNRRRYAKVPEWFDDIPRFLTTVSGAANGASAHD